MTYELDYPNEAQCNDFSGMSCFALSVMATLALFLRSAHISRSAFAWLMPLLVMTIPALAVGISYTFIAKVAKYSYQQSARRYELFKFQGSPYLDDIFLSLRKNQERVSKYTENGIELCGAGLILSLLVIIALPICVAFFSR